MKILLVFANDDETFDALKAQLPARSGHVVLHLPAGSDLEPEDIWLRHMLPAFAYASQVLAQP